MKTLPQLLRDADPLSSESRESAHQRQLNRQRILASARLVKDLPRRRRLTMAIVALPFIGLAAGAAYQWRAGVDLAAAVRFEVRLAEESPGAGLREVVVSATGHKIYLHPDTIVTNSDIATAAVIQDAVASRYGVSVTFTADGAAKMLRATENRIGRLLAILLDGDVVAAPVVRSPASTSAIISGNYTRAEAERIVAGIVGR